MDPIRSDGLLFSQRSLHRDRVQHGGPDFRTHLLWNEGDSSLSRSDPLSLDHMRLSLRLTNLFCAEGLSEVQKIFRLHANNAPRGLSMSAMRKNKMNTKSGRTNIKKLLHSLTSAIASSTNPWGSQ